MIKTIPKEKKNVREYCLSYFYCQHRTCCLKVRNKNYSTHYFNPQEGSNHSYFRHLQKENYA